MPHENSSVSRRNSLDYGYLYEVKDHATALKEHLEKLEAEEKEKQEQAKLKAREEAATANEAKRAATAKEKELSAVRKVGKSLATTSFAEPTMSKRMERAEKKRKIEEVEEEKAKKRKVQAGLEGLAVTDEEGAVEEEL